MCRLSTDLRLLKGNVNVFSLNAVWLRALHHPLYNFPFSVAFRRAAQGENTERKVKESEPRIQPRIARVAMLHISTEVEH